MHFFIGSRQLVNETKMFSLIDQLCTVQWIQLAEINLELLQNYVAMKNAFVDKIDDVMTIFNTWNTTILTSSKHSGILCQPQLN